MAYITYTELTNRYQVITTWNTSESIVTDDLIYYAEVELNGRLASHFTVPFAAAHPTVKDLTMDMAYYKALVTKDPEKAEKIHDVVIGRIEKIKKGEEYIYTGSGTTILPTGAGEEIWSSTEDYHPVHSMFDAEDPLTRISSEQLYDEAQERE